MEAIVILVLILLAIVLIATTTSASSRIGELQRQMASLIRRVAELESLATARKPEAKGPTPAPAVPPPEIKITGAIAPSPEPAIQPHQLTIPAAAKTSRTKEEWEALIGGKLLNRIGALALIIGVGFFLKYAFDNNWITESMRVGVGLLAGAVALIAAAHSSGRGYQIFAQGLVGAGIAILYLSVYASFNFYHLVSQQVAFLCMSVVTVVTFTQAFRYDSIAVSVIGWLGGFLTPFLLSTGEANEVGLFTYVALLDIGILIVLTRKDKWMILEPLALGGTYVLFFLWFDNYYSHENLAVTLLFLCIFWGMFHMLDLLRSVRGTATYPEARRLFATFHALFFSTAVYGTVRPEGNHWAAGATLVIGILYFTSTLLASRMRPEFQSSSVQFMLTAIILLVIATALEFKGFTTVACWSIEALLLFWGGVRWRLGFVWMSALALFGLSVLTLFGTNGAIAFTPVTEFTPFLNQRASTFLTLLVSIAVSAHLCLRVEDKKGNIVREILHYGWSILLFLLITVEINDSFRRMLQNASGADSDSIGFNRFLTLAVAWAAYSLPLVWIGLRQQLRPVLFSGLWISLVAIILGCIRGIAYVPIERFGLLLNERALVILLLIGAAALLARWLKDSNQFSGWTWEIRGVIGVATVILILVLLTGETRDYFEKGISLLERGTGSRGEPEQLVRLENLKQLSLSSGWLLYSIGLMAVGLWRRDRGLRIQAIVLFGISIVKIFIYDLSFLDTLYRIFSFIGLGLILLMVSYLYQRHRGIVLGPSQ